MPPITQRDYHRSPKARHCTLELSMRPHLEYTRVTLAGTPVVFSYWPGSNGVPDRWEVYFSQQAVTINRLTPGELALIILEF